MYHVNTCTLYQELMSSTKRHKGTSNPSVVEPQTSINYVSDLSRHCRVDKYLLK